MKLKPSWQLLVCCHLCRAAIALEFACHMLSAAASELHQKDTANVEAAEEPSESAQHAAAAAADAETAPLGGPIGPHMPQPAPSASGLSDDDTMCAPGPQLPGADSNRQQLANGMACPVVFQLCLLLLEIN